jgi:hypothetical protein
MRAWVLMMVLPLAACSMTSSSTKSGVVASGTGTSRDFPVSGFTAVALTGSDDVDVRIGKDFAVHAQGPSDVLDKLLIERDGDTLKIGRKTVIGFDWESKGAKITVTMPAIAAATLAGSGGLTVEQAVGSSFHAATTGSGELNIAALDVQKADFSVTGSGGIIARGKAATLDLSITGSGDIDAKQVQASNASVSAVGSGSTTATVNGPASVSMMGSGDVNLGPGAKCTINKMGSGDVTCGH